MIQSDGVSLSLKSPKPGKYFTLANHIVLIGSVAKNRTTNHKEYAPRTMSLWSKSHPD
jgi:hypothetical protein